MMLAFQPFFFFSAWISLIVKVQGKSKAQVLGRIQDVT